ncbi:MAG TPA: hypothetical protein VIM98_13370 [Dyella sp.]|uniref:hypothetical protein n=1 Tax=Dyella sp. TaxID=1869338 RepID=UPI002F94F729
MTDFKDTLYQALEELGCRPGRFSFDAQSPIVMNFSDIEDIHIEPGESVSIWGMLPDMEAGNASHGLSDLMQELATPADFLAAGGFVVRRSEQQRFLVGGPLTVDHASNAGLLAIAIQTMYERMAQLRERMR